MAEILKDAVLLKKGNSAPDTEVQELTNCATVIGETALKGKVVALFFSAAWCPPCQHFVPVLRDVYEDLIKRESDIEIVFISMDKTEDEMKDYYQEKHGNWLALQYADPQKEVLVEKYNISIIPKLIVIGPDGEVITSKGRKDIQDKGLISFRGWHSAMMAAAKKADQHQQFLEQQEAGMDTVDEES